MTVMVLVSGTIALTEMVTVTVLVRGVIFLEEVKKPSAGADPVGNEGASVSSRKGGTGVVAGATCATSARVGTVIVLKK